VRKFNKKRRKNYIRKKHTRTRARAHARTIGELEKIVSHALSDIY